MMSVAALAAFAQEKTEVTAFRLAGPFAVTEPWHADTVDVEGKRFDDRSMLERLKADTKPTTEYRGQLIPSIPDSKSVGVLSFYINNSSYVKGKISVKGLKNYKLVIDGSNSDGDIALAPEHHTVALKFLSQPNDTDSIHVTIDASRKLDYTLSEEHPYGVHDLTDGKRVRNISLSADGSIALVCYQETARGGKNWWTYELRDVRNGKLISNIYGNLSWMPHTVALYDDAWEADRRNLYKIDAFSGERTLIAADLPKGNITFSPNEDYLIISAETEGPKEDKDVFQVLEMDDRQPGWRKRGYLIKYEIASGLAQRITFGNKGEYLYDISRDGRKLIVGSSHSRLTKRPTTVSDVVIIDAQTLKADTVFLSEEHIGGIEFAPDGRQLLIKGNPEAFNRIGCQLPDDVTPSMMENELFLYDLATRQVTPLTKDFNPSVESVEWLDADGNIYFSAEDRDYIRLYSLNPKTGKITQMATQGDYVYGLGIASNAMAISYLSYETLAPASAYVMNLKTGKNTRFFDGHTALGTAQVGTCRDWNFNNSRGDTVYGRLYLPADFDESKKYPMIVYYYGGCSPVSRYFESPYAPQMWNSLGYVAYILQPSGATGFGQEWASRHVNTAGEGPSDDIIEGTKKICEEHHFIDAEHIGCMGASYGGFMTQYLQTKTEIFAAAVSHAGIANHTSYWGQGYWGYNYSEVAMANSYPWSHKQLYVDRSPLFNADKIHTPLLLLHGTADTNVPIIESLQMFTALKLLGREVALVEVEGENHGIRDYGKKIKWIATQMAWFQKWLKDDPSWWDALYPKRHL